MVDPISVVLGGLLSVMVTKMLADSGLIKYKEHHKKFIMLCYANNLDGIKMLFKTEEQTMKKQYRPLYILGYQASNIYMCDGHILTGFTIACSYGSVEIVKYINEYFPEKQYGKHLSRTCETGFIESPFLVACQRGHLNVVKYLVETTAILDDVKHCSFAYNITNNNYLYYQAAVANGHIDIVKYFQSLPQYKNVTGIEGVL
jgi:hypothetical protein